MSTILNLVGKKFGSLKVIKKEGKNKIGTLWKCLCVCGNYHVVVTKDLNYGSVKSCGCKRKEASRLATIESNTKHGAAKRSGISKDYSVWRNIKARCYTKTNRRYADYGGRGITMHKTWIKDFAIFAAYIRTLPDCPSEEILTSSKGRNELSLDRINNNRGYQPGNLKWSTLKQQANNKRSNIMVVYRNSSLTLKQACEEFSVIDYDSLYYRVAIAKWPIEKALLTPSRKKG